MIAGLVDSIGFVCLAAAVLGSVYALVAAWSLARLRPPPDARPQARPGVTILKPVRGAEPALHGNLATFCRQDYPGPVQIVFGTQDESDPAVEVVRGIVRELPGHDLELVLGRIERGTNPKVSTLVALAPHIRHEVVVLADSDIAVEPDYLARVVAALEAPGVGLVTCLYRGEPRAGFWSRLGAMQIDHHFLPGVLVALRWRLAQPCFGSTIALRADTLKAIGGFEAFLDHLADDHAMGAAVRRLGLGVAVPQLVLAHTCSESSLGELVRHEIRWARTVRAVDARGYAASVLAHPIPLALLGAALSGGLPVALAVLAGALAARLVLAVRVDHTLGIEAGRLALVPLRDLLSFFVYVASFFVAVVTWRGRRYRVRPDGTLAAIG